MTPIVLTAPAVIPPEPPFGGPEIVVLDPDEVAGNRTEFDITKWVAQAGPDWGDAAIEQYVAEARRGSLPVDFRVPNRTITIPLILLDRDPLTFWEVRDQLQAKAALFQRDGGWLKRETIGGKVYFDITGATLHLGGSTVQSLFEVDADAVLTLEALPEAYGDEIALVEHDVGGVGELVFVEPTVLGHMPARTRIVVQDQQGVAKLGLVGGLRSRHYSNVDTARLAYTATDMTRLDTAVNFGGVVLHPAVPSQWTPVLSTDLVADGPLTHTGTYRVMARVWSSASSKLSLRLVWDVGDFSNPAENDPWAFPEAELFYIADLGEVRLDPAPGADHRWRGQIQAKADIINRDLVIERVWLVPVDDGYFKLTAPPGSTVGFGGAVTRDEFAGTSADLAGTTPTVGTAWQGGGAAAPQFTRGGSTLAPDGSVFNFASRVNGASSDDQALWRIDWAGPSRAGQVVEGEVSSSHVGEYGSSASQDGPSYWGVAARVVNPYSWLGLHFKTRNLPGTRQLLLTKATGTGTSDVTLVSRTVVRLVDVADDEWYGLRLAVAASGWWQASMGLAGTPLRPLATGHWPELATGGVLAEGGSGLIDGLASTPGFNITRKYRRFRTLDLPQDAVIHSGRTVEVRSDGVFRENADGTGKGKVAGRVGDLPRLPPSGMEDRPVEVFLLPSRGDFGRLPDTALGDDIEAQVFYRPSYLFVSSF